MPSHRDSILYILYEENSSFHSIFHRTYCYCSIFAYCYLSQYNPLPIQHSNLQEHSSCHNTTYSIQQISASLPHLPMLPPDNVPADSMHPCKPLAYTRNISWNYSLYQLLL